MTSDPENGPTLETIMSATPGDAFALRAAAGDHATILAGEVDAIITTDPDAAIEELRADVGADPNDACSLSVAIVALDASILWAIPAEADEVIDNSDRLRDLPPARPYLGEPPQDPPACSVSYRGDGRLGCTIPSPVIGGGRVKFYAVDDYGTIVAFTTGPLVDPRTLLAPDESPPTG